MCAFNYTLQYRYSFTLSFISSYMTRDTKNNYMISHLTNNLHQSIHIIKNKTIIHYFFPCKSGPVLKS